MAINIKEYFSLGTDSSGNPISVKSVSEYQHPLALFSVILKNIYVIAGIILIFYIIAAGIAMILNAGNAEAQKQSSKALSSAITGFLILFGSYWILKIIELLTGVHIITY